MAIYTSPVGTETIESKSISSQKHPKVVTPFGRRGMSGIHWKELSELNLIG